MNLTAEVKPSLEPIFILFIFHYFDALPPFPRLYIYKKRNHPNSISALSPSGQIGNADLINMSGTGGLLDDGGTNKQPPHVTFHWFGVLAYLPGQSPSPSPPKRWGRKSNKIDINAFPLQECNALPRHLPATWLGCLRQPSATPPSVNKSAYGLDSREAAIKLKPEANAWELTGILTNGPEQEIYCQKTNKKIKLQKNALKVQDLLLQRL